ncbi:UDP-glycosyltransferase 84B1-like [Juglans microcarpa x Juglans regia]|uniref:UDP-glycosyltransferase 84B1-like n=1 Tax=Juglans microcarpa x Juglans regia TaxID=2249226 RepID=UPI001B7E61F2|nr:UDP-glycosyltransferase 84B1-like [Juglans microcarpa x Juglans regia]
MVLINEQNEETHVLMVAFASQGHINPLLRLGKRLVSRGLHVSLAITEIFLHRMLKSSSSSSSSTSINSISGIQLLFFSDGFSIDYDRKANLDHYVETLGKAGPVNLSNLIKDHFHRNHKKLSCIINNPFVPWVANVALEHNIPCAMLWIQPCALYAIYYRFYNNLNPFPNLANPEISVELPGLPLLQIQDLPSFVLPSNPFGSVPKLFAEMFQNIKKLKWVLGNSFFELEKEAIDSMSELCPILPVGPLVPPSLLGEDQNVDVGAIDMWQPHETCMEWLDHQPPSSVIYVSFGSIIVLSARHLESIATALKNSKRPFLWVVKVSENPTPDGAGVLPTGFLEETKDQGLIVAWSPQTKVLAHPAIACFLTHCGWNSMLEAIAAGVPLIAYPQWTDQPTNAKLIVDVLKVGVRLRPESDGVVTTEEVEKCIAEIMAGPRSEEFKKNSEEFKRVARMTVADGGSSDLNLNVFVDDVIGNSCRSSSKEIVSDVSAAVEE